MRVMGTVRRVGFGLAALATVALVCVVFYWHAETPRYQVPVPATDATPRQVARAYMTALDAGDADTVYALSTRHHRDMAHTWLAGTAHMRNLATYRPERDGTTISVPVSFDYQQKWWQDDPSMPNGHHVWSYDLVRDHGRWLVNDEGTG